MGSSDPMAVCVEYCAVDLEYESVVGVVGIDVSIESCENPNAYLGDIIRYAFSYLSVDVIRLMDNYSSAVTLTTEQVMRSINRMSENVSRWNEYGITDDVCLICKRHMPKSERSKHHLIPIASGGKGTDKVVIHRVCHNKLHSLFSEDYLATCLNTVALIINHPDMKSFIKWVKKMPDNYYDVSVRSNEKPK